MALAAAFSVHATRAAPARDAGLPPLTGALKRLIVASYLMGAATAVWSFGAQLVKVQLGWGSIGAGLLWIALGAAGIVGIAQSSQSRTTIQ